MKFSKLYYLYLLTLILFFKPCPTVLGQSITTIESIDDPIHQVEAVLQLSPYLTKDTVQLKKDLAPILKLAKKENSISLTWAYYMLLADGYSLYFDQTNSVSDNCYLKAEQLLRDHPNLELEMIGNIRQGYYNFVYRKVINAFPFFLRANDLRSKVTNIKMPFIAKHYQYVASFFSYIGDYDKAVSYLKEALPRTSEGSRQRIDMINAIAIYLSAEKANPKALTYFNLALKEAKLAKDSVWIGIISGNLADYDWGTGKRKSAIDLIKKNIELSIRYNETHDAMRANLVLSNWYIILKEWNLAKQHIAAGEVLMEDKPYFLKHKMDAAKALSDIARGLNNKDEELKQLNRYILLRDSLEKRTNIKEMQNIIWQSEREKYDRTVQAEEAKRQEVKRMYQYIGIFLTLTFAIVLLLINKSKAKIKIRHAILEKEQITLSYEKQLLDQELVILKDSLNEFTTTIKNNDTTIQQLRNEINEASKIDPTYMAQVTDSLNTMLQTHIMTDDRWMKFKHVFNKVYPEYLSQMKQKHTKITENDLKILALVKLDVSNIGMSELLCVSVDAIKKAKQRLKKKLE